MDITLLVSSSLLSLAGRSFALLLLTALVAQLLQRRSAAVLHGVWTLGLAGCLAMPLAILSSLEWSLPVLPAADSGTTTASDVVAFGLSCCCPAEPDAWPATQCQRVG